MTNQVKLVPDFKIDGNTGIDDLVDLFEANKTELFTIDTIIKFLLRRGYQAAAEELIACYLRG